MTAISLPIFQWLESADFFETAMPSVPRSARLPATGLKSKSCCAAAGSIAVIRSTFLLTSASPTRMGVLAASTGSREISRSSRGLRPAPPKLPPLLIT